MGPPRSLKFPVSQTRRSGARFYQTCSDSGLTPNSRATSVTVRPEESPSVIGSRLNSAVYRFVYVLPTSENLRGVPGDGTRILETAFSVTARPHHPATSRLLGPTHDSWAAARPGA